MTVRFVAGSCTAGIATPWRSVIISEVARCESICTVSLPPAPGAEVVPLLEASAPSAPRGWLGNWRMRLVLSACPGGRLRVRTIDTAAHHVAGVIHDVIPAGIARLGVVPGPGVYDEGVGHRR